MKPLISRDVLHRNQILLPWAPGRTVSTRRAAELLGCCETTIRCMIEDKTIQGYKLRPDVPKSTYRVNLDSLKAHMRHVLEVYEIE